jgi:hypothetical protein
MKIRGIAAPGLALLLAGGVAPAQDAKADPVITFHFERPGTQLPTYTFTVHEDGTGTYIAKYPAGALSASDESANEPLAITKGTAAKLFTEVRGTHQLKGGCASKAKNIADTGTKTLTYSNREDSAKCTWNYSEDKTIVALGDTFMGMAYTLDMGRKLATKQRFDRLGLDQEMGFLVDAVKSGHAVELSNIAPTLRSLADDASLMERVRTRAAKLLEQSSLAK